MKNIGEKIKTARTAKGLTQVQLAKLIGEKSGTVINNWESATSRPAIEKIPRLCEALNITPDILFSMKGEYPSVNEMAMVRRYRVLDDFGKTAVDSVLNVEYERVTTVQHRKPRARVLTMKFYDYPASAGTGNYFDTVKPGSIWVRETPEAERADFAVTISGDSMEPTYSDGDIVLVEKCATLDIGEIGIFTLNGDVYIKELGEKCLISHNTAYKPIKIGEADSIYLSGRVIGVVEEVFEGVVAE